jgi:hypothetical protein
LVGSAVPYSTDSPSIVAPLEVGSCFAYGQPHQGSLADVRYYVNPSWIANHAATAQDIYTAQGTDAVTDGMIIRLPFTEGVDGEPIIDTFNTGSLATQPVIEGSPVYKRIDF